MSAASREADRVLRQALVLAVRTPDHRVSSVRHLAREAGVSYVTMWRAVQRARTSGLLVALPNGRFVALSADGGTRMAEPTAPRGPAAQRLACALERDMCVRGLSEPELLPHCSVLARRYGVDRRTAAHALRELVSQGVIEEHGSRFRPVVRSRPAASNAMVVLIAAGDDAGRLLTLAYRTEEHLRLLEQGCASAGVSLAVVTCSRSGPPFHGAAPWSAELAAGRASALGYIVWSAHLTSEGVRAVIRAASAQGKPVAVLDHSGSGHQADEVSGMRHAQLVTMADNFHAGQAMGQYLLKAGHHAIAYLSPYHGTEWSQERLLGLQKAWGAAGTKSAVEAVIIDTAQSLAGLVQQRAGGVDQTLARMGAHASAAARADGLDVDGEALASAMRDALYDSVLSSALAHPVERLLRRDDVTAWVCVTDRVAQAARAHIVRLRGSAQAGPALAGFDDRMIASLGGITSFNFDGGRAVAALLSHVLGPAHARGANAPLRIAGHVVERESTRPYRG